MAATAKTIVTNAYRKAGITALGQTLNAAQLNVGISLLSDMLNDLVITGNLARLRQKYITQNYTACENEAIFANPGTITITLPTTITDGWPEMDWTDEDWDEDVWGNTVQPSSQRQPYDASVIMIKGLTGGPQIWIYDAILAQWLSIYNLTSSSNVPLSSSYKTDLEAMLAVKLAGERGIDVTPEVAREAAAARVHLASRNVYKRKPARGDYM